MKFGVGLRGVCHRLFAYVPLFGALVFCVVFTATPTLAATGINQQINFQGRLLNIQGATVPDGYYNIQFKIYRDGDGLTAGNATGSPAGALLWTENHLNQASQGVQVKNGFMSVQLGSITPFGSSIDWNQDTLWLSMNIGDTNASCTPFSSCTPDGEMVPMKRMSATPYALNAGQLGGLSASNFVQLAPGTTQTDATTNSSISINKTSTGNFLTLQNAGANAFALNNSGDVVFGANADHSISVAAAGAGVTGKTLTVVAGAAGTGATVNGGDLMLQGGAASGTGTSGNVIVKSNGSNSSGAFQVQNSSGTAAMIVDTTSNTLKIAGTIDTTTSTTLSLGGTNATAINLDENTSVTSSNTFTVGTGLASLGGGLAVTAGAVDVTSSAAFKKGTDFSTTGTTNNANLGEASYIRLTGASAQTITGIANGRDGEILTLTNAASQAATIANNSGSSSAANRIITGSGVDLTLGAGASVTLVYDSSASLWRATGSAAGVTTVGAIDTQTKSANGAVISGTSIYLQTADASSVGVVSTGAQTLAGAKTFSSLLTGSAGATFSGGALSMTGNAASSLTTSSGALTLTSAAAATWSTAAGNLTLQAGSGTVTLGSSTALTSSGALTVTGGTILALTSTGANAASIDTGGAAAVNIGGVNATTIQVGSTSGTLTQNIGIGNNNTGGSTTNVTIGAGGSATGGTTTVQAKGNITINTNGVTRGTFDTSNVLYLGNGVTAGAPNDFTISATGSSTTAVPGAKLTLQGGNATAGTANGGTLALTGGSGFGSGVKGLVTIDTPTMTTAGTQSCGSNCNITQANIDGNGAVLINATAGSLTITLSDPTITTAGRVMYVTNFGANDFTLAVNGGVGATNIVTLKPNTTATMIWNGVDWTAAGASSSTDLQAAYNNTASSAGAAELVLKNTSTSNGLTIRNGTGSDEIIGGGLVEIQTSIGSNLFAVNNNATEYANNGGAETSTFTMWTGAPAGGTISRYTTAGNNIATGIASVFVDTTTTAATGVRNTLSSTLTANLKYRVSYAVRHTSSTVAFTTLDTVFSRDGTNTATVDCATGQTATFGQWTRISCTFTAPSSGITSSNAIFIRHSDGVEHDFYIDNLSVTVSADVNHATDGSVDLALGSNWQGYDADGGAGTTTLTRETTTIYDTSGSVKDDVTNNANEGMRNNMSITPQVSTQYLVSFYARSSTAFTNITVGFLPAGGSSTPNAAQLCVDYNTQTVSTSGWTKVTCLVTTPASGITDPDLVIYQPTAPGAIRTFYVDALSITLNTNNASNVQVGGGNKGGPATLFTLDRSNGAPIANNNDNYLGSMYYDTSTGRIQCYEADGWGACGAAPDNIVNLNPEYAGAVLNGTGVGTMTADFCSNDTALTINSTLCSTGQAKNFYRWTSPQGTQQTYSIYVTYQLPATFNGFSSDDTVQLVARVDNTTNASVTYEMYKSTGSAVTQCGTGETNVITGGGGSANTWYSYGINGNEATGCSFSSSSAGNLVIFKINVKANSNANAYVSTLTFTTTGR